MCADSGFENQKVFKRLDGQGVEFSIGVKQHKGVRDAIEEIGEDEWQPPRPAAPANSGYPKTTLPARPTHHHRPSTATSTPVQPPHPRSRPPTPQSTPSTRLCGGFRLKPGRDALPHHSAGPPPRLPESAAVSQPPASVLSDGTIVRLVAEGRIKIDPWDETLVQPASVDLRLGSTFRVFHNHKITAIDLRDPPRGLTEQVSPPEGEPFVIHPGEFCLGRTLEHVELPGDIVARIEGKSSLGRLGLIVHATAGFCDPGWRGTLTLELNNLTRVPIKLYPGLPIAQLSFMTLDAPARRPYGHKDLGSHYQGQVEATESRYGVAKSGPQEDR